MDTSLDILSIHNYILKKYEYYQFPMDNENDTRFNDVKEMTKDQVCFFFYLVHSMPLLEKYKEKKKKEKKIIFFNKNKSSQRHEEDITEMLIKQYKRIISFYFSSIHDIMELGGEEFLNATSIPNKDPFLINEPKIISPLDENNNHHSQNQEENKSTTVLKKSQSSTKKSSSLSSATTSTQLQSLPSSQQQQQGPSLKNICECSHSQSKENTSSLHHFENHSVCPECGLVNNDVHQAFQMICYRDIVRVNISRKYTYDRKTHFRDCILQFQGKQNSYIPPILYEKITEELLSHGLIPENYKDLPKKIAFEQVTKEYIFFFMKQLGYSQYYDDIVLIYKELTDGNVPDITHLENELLKDFYILSDTYEKYYKQDNHTNNKTKRKNFLSTPYILYQLLQRHKYQCSKKDFNMLKTLDRKYYHDDICQELFEILGWNFKPTF